MNKLKRKVISKDFTVNYSFMDSSVNTRYSEHSPFINPKKKPSRQRSIDIYEKDISQNEKNPFRQSLNSSSASTTISSTEYDIKILQSKIDTLKTELKDIDCLISKQSQEINEVIDKKRKSSEVRKNELDIENVISEKESLEEILQHHINELSVISKENRDKYYINDDIAIYIEDIFNCVERIEDLKTSIESVFDDISDVDININFSKHISTLNIQLKNSSLSAKQIANNFINSLARDINMNTPIVYVIIKYIIKIASLNKKIETEIRLPPQNTNEVKKFDNIINKLNCEKMFNETRRDKLNEQLSEMTNKLDMLLRNSISSVNNNMISSFNHTFYGSTPAVNTPPQLVRSSSAIGIKSKNPFASPSLTPIKKHLAKEERSHTPLTNHHRHIGHSIHSETESFCYFKRITKNTEKFNPLVDSDGTPESLGYIKGFISVDFKSGVLRIEPKSPRESDIEVSLRRINATTVSSIMKDIITVHRVYRKYSKKSDNFQNKIYTINSIVKLKELSDVRMDVNDKIKAAMCHLFSFSIVCNDYKEKIDIVFVSYEEFKNWLNGIGMMMERDVTFSRGNKVQIEGWI